MKQSDKEPQILAQTFELGQARLRLRSDLRFTLHNDSTSQWYLVEDESCANFFRVGITEYAFLSLLNGRRTLDEAIAKLASLGCCDDLDETKAANLARWVIDSGLAETAAAKSLERIDDQRGREKKEATAQWMNPIAFRIPLFNPDKILGRIYGLSRSIVGWPVFFIWLIVCLCGCLTLSMVWGGFWTNQIRSLSSWDFLWLAGTWIVLKVFHEGAHGLVCKHYGGRVPQFGILMLLLIPLPFVDVSSAWRFTSKSKRILTSAAGMLAEGFIASIAIVVWANCGPGPVQYHMGNLFIAATVNTLLFNANPLMKFDGYYILIDWLEIPNLYTRGRAFVKQFFKWIFFGVPFQSETESSRSKVRIVRLYGVSAMTWFVLICVTLGTAAASMFSGFGLLVALAALVLWVGLPLVNLSKYLLKKQKTESPSRLRFALVTGIGLAMIFGAGVGLPSPTSIRAPVVIVDDVVAVVRTRTAGFVEIIHVRDGQPVAKGEPLLTLVNPQLLADIAQLEMEIAASELRASVFKNDGDLATWQIENETLQGLQEQWQELDGQRKQLSVVSPISGRVSGKHLEELAQVYLGAGEDLVTIVDPGSKHAVAMVAQHDAIWLRKNTNMNAASIRLWGSDQTNLNGKIKKISPQATDRVPHFSFASTNGGPLSVVSRRQVDSEVADSASGMQRKTANLKSNRNKSLTHFASHRIGNDAGEELKLIRQYVPVKIGLSASDAKTVATGQAGYMLTGGRGESLGGYVYQNVRRWIASQIRLTHGL